MNVFVYGTLTNPERAQQVLDRCEYTGHATLIGLHRIEGRYPTLVPNGSVQGRILQTDSDGLDALDDYESVHRGLYVRKSVPASVLTDERSIEVYIGDSERLSACDRWPGDEPFTERVERYITTHNVHIQVHD
jgi:gamma-glutamylaminecyclotransferase